MSCENRLKFLNLPTLTYRRFKGDRPMIKTFIILNYKYDQDEPPSLSFYNKPLTRGN